MALLAELVAVGATCARADKQTYMGSTSQGTPFKLTVASDVLRFASPEVHCHDGQDPFKAQTASQRPLRNTPPRIHSRENYDAQGSDGVGPFHYVIRSPARTTPAGGPGLAGGCRRRPVQERRHLPCAPRAGWCGRRALSSARRGHPVTAAADAATIPLQPEALGVGRAPLRGSSRRVRHCVARAAHRRRRQPAGSCGGTRSRCPARPPRRCRRRRVANLRHAARERFEHADGSASHDDGRT
jgi:hypothetical protein